MTGASIYGPKLLHRHAVSKRTCSLLLAPFRHLLDVCVPVLWARPCTPPRLYLTSSPLRSPLTHARLAMHLQGAGGWTQ